MIILYQYISYYNFSVIIFNFPLFTDIEMIKALYCTFHASVFLKFSQQRHQQCTVLFKVLYTISVGFSITKRCKKRCLLNLSAVSSCVRTSSTQTYTMRFWKLEWLVSGHRLVKCEVQTCKDEGGAVVFF